MMDKRAAITWGAIGTAIGALISLLREFGVSITQGQETALLKFTAVGLPIVIAFIIQGYVWSKASVREKVAEAHQDGLQGTAEPPKVV
jgi:hypothetical protein